MSVQALAWVFDAAPADLTMGQRLVLLSIANHADARGENSWPSIATIAKEAGISERSVHDALRKLEAMDVIDREVNEGGNRKTQGNRRPNRYTILAMIEDAEVTRAALEAYSGVEPTSTPTDARGGSCCTPGVEAASTQTVLEPSQPTPPSPPRGEREKAESALTDERAATEAAVIAIFEAWKDATGHKRAVLDKARRKKIEDRLRDGYAVDELIAAVQGVRHSKFHMGENERHQKYDDLALILRDAEHVERFANLELQARRRKAAQGGKETWMDRSRPIEELT